MTCGLRIQIGIAFAALSLPAYACPAQYQSTPTELVNLVARAAACIYYPHFDADTPEKIFDESELLTLSEHKNALNLMIRDALGRGHSVCGAYLTALFGIKENLDLLRYHILEPGRTYGWEGLYTSDEERYLSDGQYVYHARYIAAAEQVAGKPLHTIYTLSDKEKLNIVGLVRDPSSESHYWAIWIGRKFKIL